MTGANPIKGAPDEDVEMPDTPPLKPTPPPPSRWQVFKKEAFQKKNLMYFMLAGVVVGIALGAGLYGLHLNKRVVEIIGYPGELFLNALQELVLPLIALALLNGVLSLRHSTAGAGRVMGWALFYYFLSMVLAVILGIALTYIIRPGRDTPFEHGSGGDCAAKNTDTIMSKKTVATQDTLESLLNVGRDMLPKNIIKASAESSYLGIMVFMIAFGVVLSGMGPTAEPLIQILETANDVIMKLVWLVIYLTPFCIASLICSTILQACNLLVLLKSLSYYVATVLTGFAVHSIFSLPLTLFLLARVNPLSIMRAYIPAFAMGFGTSSSAATMPMTMECASKYGCRDSLVKFVIPLGTNINRDGAALYEATSVIFIAQAHGLSLSIGNVIVIAITATLAAIGAASIPMSALVSMITVLQAVGMQEYVKDLSVILAVDWLLGMFRTITNIWGDCCAVTVVEMWARRHDNKLARQAKKADVVKADTIVVALPASSDTNGAGDFSDDSAAHSALPVKGI
ncbi:hypothetical protein WJX81_003155 [Elliptochloris bilobata]|uniref:Amino acid transporter n=1 Tax=Elliptochloris bilobata TaxID=381761 RepID=A0AAW1RUC5_9CHLO